MKKVLPETLTSYDLLKAAAIVLMVVDHIGSFFYPHDVWWRVWGRLCVPMWFFLIGYARTRTVQNGIWIGGVVILLSNIVFGRYIFPLPILFTLGLTRLLIDRIMERALRHYEALAGVLIALVIVSLHTSALVEYGTIGVPFAMFGYMVRHGRGAHISRMAFFLFVVAAFAGFIGNQFLLMGMLTTAQWGVLLSGMVVVAVVLSRFSAETYPALTRYGGAGVPVVQFLGRHTLLIYVVHFVIFSALYTVFIAKGATVFGFKIMAEGFLLLFL